MAIAFRGKLLFIGTGVFALGILSGTLFHVSWACVVLGVLFSVFCFLLLALDIPNAFFILTLGICIAAFLLGEVRAALTPRTLRSAFMAMLSSLENPRPISLIGEIETDPDVRQKNQQFIITFEKNGQRTNVLVFAPLFQHFKYGEKVLVAGTLIAPENFVTDAGRTFRYDNFLAKKGVFAIISQADILEIAPPSGVLPTFAGVLFDAKHVFTSGLKRALPDPYAELATGLLTGDQHGLGDALVTTLALSGLIWVVVLSGYHVTLIAAGVLKIFGFLPRRFGFVFAGLAIACIVFATGATAPSLRGGIMACLTLYARATNRTYDALRALCIAIISVLLWNPFLLAYDSGFQLSIVVTPALLIATPILESRMLWIKSKFLREIICVSVVAQLACLPLILWQVGELGLWSIPANMFVMSLVPLAMITSFVAGVAGVLLPQLASLAGLPAYAILSYILYIAKTSAALPLADVVLPPFPFVLVLAMYGILIWFVILLRSESASQ
jgi:competence protein ComEC